MLKTDLIPIISLKEFESDPYAFSQKVGNAFKDFGFVGIKDHTIPVKLLNKNYELLETLFNLENKNDYACAELGFQRGYLPLGGEKHSGPTEFVDFKECYQVGRKGTPNIFPKELPEFEFYNLKLFKLLECEVGVPLLKALDIYLGSESYLENLIKSNGKLTGTHLLRNIKYPPIDNPELFEDGFIVRGSTHLDLNLITLLPVSTLSGLQVYSKKHGWISVDMPSGVIICNAGDMLQLITEGHEKEIKSTPHRIIGTKESCTKTRFSMPMFIHPQHNKVLKNLVSGKLIQYSGKEMSDAGEFVYYRLRNLLTNSDFPTYDVWRKENNKFIIG